MKYLQYICYALVIIGAINWGLVGLFRVDIVASIFGQMTVLSRIIYTLIGIAGGINLVLELTVCKSPSRCYVT